MKKPTSNYIEIESISELHAMVQYSPPRHPLVSVIDHKDFYAKRPRSSDMYRFGFYTISCKKFKGLLYYGKSRYDFREGSLMFTAPGQVIGAGPDIKVEEGWALFFHPDLLRGTNLGKRMHEYSFFHYEVNEALHISEEEAAIMQFYTRAKVNADVVQLFEALLKDYFSQEVLIEAGLPPVIYFASKLNLSPNYLSDLLQKFTGKSTLEHIHLELVERAKSLLWATDRSISGIAYDLGFEHPSHFTKIFKAKTGKSPRDYRNVN